MTPEVQQTLLQGRSVTAGTGKSDAPRAVAVPIVLRSQTIGALNLSLREEQATSETVTLVEEVASRLALMLESARLYQETQQRAARERTIGEITGRVRESLNVDTMLQAAVRELGEVLGAARVQVRLGTGRTLDSESG
jgi:GAF domain-containing protein